MRTIDGLTKSIPLKWLSFFCNIVPPKLLRERALLQEWKKYANNPSLPIHEDLATLENDQRLVTQALYEGWISRYGVPDTITTDQGRQFESTLFWVTSNILALRRIRTTAYHSAANGLVERLHRVFKAAIKCHNIDR